MAGLYRGSKRLGEKLKKAPDRIAAHERVLTAHYFPISESLELWAGG